jgi:hypothetical protein
MEHMLKGLENYLVEAAQAGDRDGRGKDRHAALCAAVSVASDPPKSRS